jgi:hypothetical protein
VAAKQTGSSPPLAEFLFGRQETGLDLWVGLHPADTRGRYPELNEEALIPLKPETEGRSGLESRRDPRYGEYTNNYKLGSNSRIV